MDIYPCNRIVPLMVKKMSFFIFHFLMQTEKLVNQECGEGASSSNNCCTPDNPCDVGMGSCNGNEDCVGSLICGDKNCGTAFLKDDNCCEVNKIDNEDTVGESESYS